MFASVMTILIIPNEEMNDVMKVIKSLEECGLLIKVVSEIIKVKEKEQNGWFLSILLRTLSASLLRNLLKAKGRIATSQEWGTNRAGKSTFRAGEGTVKAGHDF